MNVLKSLRHWFRKSFTSSSASPTGFLDSFRQRRQPTNDDLLRELKNTAFVCASINAATCASFPPRLFVRTTPGMPEREVQ